MSNENQTGQPEDLGERWMIAHCDHYFPGKGLERAEYTDGDRYFLESLDQGNDNASPDNQNTDEQPETLERIKTIHGVRWAVQDGGRYYYDIRDSYNRSVHVARIKQGEKVTSD